MCALSRRGGREKKKWKVRALENGRNWGEMGEIAREFQRLVWVAALEPWFESTSYVMAFVVCDPFVFNITHCSPVVIMRIMISLYYPFFCLLWSSLLFLSSHHCSPDSDRSPCPVVPVGKPFLATQGGE